MKPLYFYVLLALFILFWLLLYKPYELFGSKTEEPAITLKDFAYSELDEKGERLALRAKKGLYEQKSFKIQKPTVQNNSGETLSADLGYYDDHLLRLQGNVRYIGKEYRFFTKRAIYDTAAQKLIVPTPFELRGPNMLVRGRKLYYFKKIGTIEAFDIDAKADVR